MAHKRFNFKSSGTKITNRKFTDPVVVEKPIGIKTPLEFGEGQDDLYKTHSNPGDQIRDNLKNLVLTNFGERLGNCNFGANLIDLTFDLSAIENFESEAFLRIQNAVRRYIPAIALREITVVDNVSASSVNSSKLSGDSFGLSLITLRINYDIPSVKIFNQSLEVLVYVGG